MTADAVHVLAETYLEIKNCLPGLQAVSVTTEIDGRFMFNTASYEGEALRHSVKSLEALKQKLMEQLALEGVRL